MFVFIALVCFPPVTNPSNQPIQVIPAARSGSTSIKRPT
jgi:hypothetical protein